MTDTVNSYLEVTLDVKPENREAAAKVYSDYKEPFLKTIPGAISKNLLVRDADVQVLHGFDSFEQAQNYLESSLFNNDVVVGLKPLLEQNPEIRIYTVN
ncbi:hypothetical protein J3T78_13435 [Staphylococcus nepalensis]|uniref:Uncharacterized protein n=1 Tax=Staphylococcus nepalensis TaxID=214473 RepID=A0ABS3L489_9STAP|nr:hypothetical protein [Staphylococcus nepalensis]MBO1212179.1 hypothetical protein [Staphylococcus nepalensis]MBO1217563.1 hypothetical protein [Staphylococcus nepalensis]MBO1228376.1 hypothetical protein [Staphylococcus nepalensis]MBO1235446.1 hypothetical protein [Staphylococcus nepalensis]MBO1238670.1 hypothetical protein [Staphylococcus nepalensis]